MIVINLAIMKSFVDDRNSFIIEERRNLDVNLNVNFYLDTNNEDKPQYISQNIEKVLTDSLCTTIGCIPEKSPDHRTSVITTPNSAHKCSPANAAVSAANAAVTLQEKVHSQASTQNLDQEDDWKSNMSTRIINETTLRISVPRDHEITSLTTPRAFATLHTPEILATSISETITATNRVTSCLNTQDSPLLLFSYEPA